MKVPKGYILWLAKPNGEVFEEIDLEAYNYTVLARDSLVKRISDALRRELLSHSD